MMRRRRPRRKKRPAAQKESFLTPRLIRELFSWVLLTAGAVVLAVILVVAFGKRMEMTGDAMEPTLASGRYVLVDRLRYQLARPSEDDIIVFHQLNDDNMKEIVNLLAKNLTKRCESQMDIHLSLTPALKEHLVKKYSDNKMGARPLKRAIQSVVEDSLAEEILAKKVKPGDTVSAGFKDDKVTFRVKGVKATE